MLKKLTNILFSNRLTAILFIVFAIAMITGTFLDASQQTSPTPYTRTLIYNSWWFETILAFFVINFAGNISRYRLFRKEKWATLTLHIAFIFILLGAFITRYISYEGMMAIREGATENSFLSNDVYLTTYIDGNYMVNGQQQRLVRYEKTDFSPRLDNNFKFKADYNGQPVSIELVDFISGAEEDIIPDDSGESYLKIVETGHNHFLKVGTVVNIHSVLYALNQPTEGAVNITYTDSTFTIKSPFEGEYMTMATGAQGKLVKDSIQPLVLRSRYIIGNQAVVFPKPVTKGVFDIVKKPEILRSDEDGIALKVTANDETQIVKLLGGKGTSNAFKQVTIGGLDFAFRYGSKVIELPFSIKLNDFVAERYPGTQKSYSAFSSQVTVLDAASEDFDYKIFMNNILDYKGYRFFQSSFDPDEKGTVLSVNHDFWGTSFTYVGYFMLFFGLLSILFAKHTRFDDLRKQLRKVKAKKAKLLLSILLFGFVISVQAQQTSTDNYNHRHITKVQVDSFFRANITPKEQAGKFGKIVIQDIGGRMMPVNTYASELLRKLSKHDNYEEFDANQVYLSMQESPAFWYDVPIIYLALKKADTIRNIIGLDKSKKYATLSHFFDNKGRYKLAPFLQDAYSSQSPTAIQKEFREADQRVNLLYSAIEGSSLKIFPIPDDENNKWISSQDYKTGNYKIQDSLYANFINTGFKAYLYMLNNSKASGDYTESDKLLDAIKRTQFKFGSDVMISDKKVNAEVLYNKYDIFKKLFSWYMYAGTLMFVLIILQIFKNNFSLFLARIIKIIYLLLSFIILLGTVYNSYIIGGLTISNIILLISFSGIIIYVLLSKDNPIQVAINLGKFSIISLFILHTIGLITRWYVSGHVPWSDAYESMIYVAWATMLFGLVFGRKSDLTIASTAFVTAMILMIAHWNWMDPAIANLQPVLDSYWLMIHVSIIVASYGPFTLGMILGVVALLLMVFTNKNNKDKMWLNIKELTIINEMALTVGLVMLTIGNFLGGMWANESWGRYWGWDPKETWALISIMVYAFVIHMRLVPGLRGRFGFNFMSIAAYSSIIFTYFGVNFYLSGLHSYQSGQQIASINIIIISVAIIALLGFIAYKKYVKYYKK